MPNTYSLIASSVISSSTTTVTFNSIPAGYTDLALRIRVLGVFSINGYFNGTNSTSLYSLTYLRGYNASASSSTNTASYKILTEATAYGPSDSTYGGSGEVYIPNYTSSANKQYSAGGFGPYTTATDEVMAVQANLWRGTSAITSITMDGNGYDFLAGSSFYLYGIAKS